MRWNLRWLVLLGALPVLGGAWSCSSSRTGGYYSCADGGVCPAGTVCSNGVCVSGAGGSGGSGGVGGAAGVSGSSGVGGTTSSCAPGGDCSGCTGCFDLCLCGGGTADACLSGCSTGGAGGTGGGVGGTGGGFGGSAGSSGFGGTAGSSGFGGTAGSSGFGGTGGTSANCDPYLQQNECGNCVRRYCCTQAFECLSEETCSGLLVCLDSNCSAAPDYQACANQSCGQFLSAVPRYNAFASCVEEGCTAECAGP